MLDFKKKAEHVPVEELRVANCPACKAYVCHVYLMQDKPTGKKSKWFSCSCGVVFQDKKPTGVYNQSYYDNTSNLNPKSKDSYEYPVRIYAPLIEELIYGRRVLLLGQNNNYQSDAFAERGWIPTTIDKNSRYKDSDRLIAADFESYKFNLSTKFNLIWIYHTLDNLIDPIASLELCKTLLAEDGIIVVMGADTDFINTRSSSCFVHWKPDYNHIMWNRRSLTRQLDSLGFNVIMSRQNYEHRFPVWDDYHILAQKKFF
jgi:hypothetical protein